MSVRGGVRPMGGSKNGGSFLISDVEFWGVGLVKGLIIGSVVFSSQKTVTEEVEMVMMLLINYTT
jgi:hypothetical protein